MEFGVGRGFSMALMVVFVIGIGGDSITMLSRDASTVIADIWTTCTDYHYAACTLRAPRGARSLMCN